MNGPTFSLQKITVRPGMEGLPCGLCDAPIETGVLLRVPNMDDNAQIGGALFCENCAAGLRDALAALSLPASDPEAFTIVDPASS